MRGGMPLLGVLAGGGADSLSTVLLLLLASSPLSSWAGATDWPAKVNYSYTENNQTRSKGDIGVYVEDSPRWRVEGKVVVADGVEHRACTNESTNSVKPANGTWIALIQCGVCNVRKKILLANSCGAQGAVIYNSESGDPINRSHPGTGDTVAIMIAREKGLHILNLINSGKQVTMVIEVAQRHGGWMSSYSIFFVSVSFFIVTAATVGYFIFYSARRLRQTRAQNKKLQKLKADAKSAIGQLQLRTLKQWDTEVGPEGDGCAVCIDNYKTNDVVRVLTCNHFFHKSCIDPWLLEHRTCPMCKCDILKALGIEVDEEEARAEAAPDLTSNEPPTVLVPVPATAPPLTEENTHSETASSGYASVRGVDETPKEASASVEHTDDRKQLVNKEPNTLDVDVLPHLDNPSFEGEELKS